MAPRSEHRPDGRTRGTASAWSAATVIARMAPITRDRPGQQRRPVDRGRVDGLDPAVGLDEVARRSRWRSFAPPRWRRAPVSAGGLAAMSSGAHGGAGGGGDPGSRWSLSELLDVGTSLFTEGSMRSREGLGGTGRGDDEAGMSGTITRASRSPLNAPVGFAGGPWNTRWWWPTAGRWRRGSTPGSGDGPPAGGEKGADEDQELPTKPLRPGRPDGRQQGHDQREDRRHLRRGWSAGPEPEIWRVAAFVDEAGTSRKRRRSRGRG